MEYILGTKDRDELENLTNLVRRRDMRGYYGTWEEFLKLCFPKFGHNLTRTSFYGKSIFISFLDTFRKKEDTQLLLAWLSNPGRILAHVLTRESRHDTEFQRLVRLTHTRDDRPLDYFLSPLHKAEDWVVTGLGKKKPTKADMIAVCCEMVRCDDGSETVVRLAAVDRHLKVILDQFVKPNQPISDLQNKLGEFLSLDTILVGHFLNQDLNALKIDHARKIDTSLLFEYEYSGQSKPPRPSLDYLSKSILGYQVQEAPQKAEAVMKLVLAIVELGVATSIPLPEELKSEMLKTEKSKSQGNESSKKRKRGKKVSSKKRKKNASCKKQSGENNV